MKVKLKDVGLILIGVPFGALVYHLLKGKGQSDLKTENRILWKIIHQERNRTEKAVWLHGKNSSK